MEQLWTPCSLTEAYAALWRLNAGLGFTDRNVDSNKYLKLTDVKHQPEAVSYMDRLAVNMHACEGLSRALQQPALFIGERLDEGFGVPLWGFPTPAVPTSL